MSRATHTIPLIICVCLAVIGLAACGGGSSDGTVAQVGSYAITKTMLNRWMTEKASEDYYDAVGREAPPRLVSEPADYSACVASLKAITPVSSGGKPQPKPTATELTSKCKELYQAVKTQALAFLVSSYWSINLDANHGINVTDEEVQQELKRIRTEQYPTEADFQRLLANRNRTLAQELFIVRMDLLGQKVEKKLKNGNRQLSVAFVRDAKRTAASASCSPGYVVEYCKGYKAPKTSATSNAHSPAALLEEIAR